MRGDAAAATECAGLTCLMRRVLRSHWARFVHDGDARATLQVCGIQSPYGALGGSVYHVLNPRQTLRCEWTRCSNRIPPCDLARCRREDSPRHRSAAARNWIYDRTRATAIRFGRTSSDGP